MPSINWKASRADFDVLVPVQNAIKNAVSEFFAPGIQAVEDECNRLSRQYQQEWQQKGSRKMEEFELPDLAYSDGIKEIQAHFRFTEPHSINIEMLDSASPLRSHVAADCTPSQDSMTDPVIRIYLPTLNIDGSNISWKGFSTSFRHIIFHELAHACGDSPLHNPSRRDGVLRQTLIVGKAIDNLSRTRN